MTSLSYEPDFGSPRYLPILKARQGELRALEELSDAALSDDLCPIVELVDTFLEANDPAEQTRQVTKLANKLMKAWKPGRPRLILDTLGIENDPETYGPYVDGPDLLSPTTELLDLLQRAGVRAVPVARVSDEPEFTDRLAYWLRSHPTLPRERGACIRIGGEDLDDTILPLDKAVSRLLERLQLDPDQVDLVLDFGAVSEPGTLAMVARLARFVLPALALPAWRSFAVSAGAFPVNLAEVGAFTLAEIPRLDRELWAQLDRFQTGRALDYSDYAVTHPQLQTGVAFAAPPQVRYATQGQWLVLKGRRTDRRGHRQIFDLCARLRQERLPDMSSPNLSWGDDWIARAVVAAQEPDPSMGPGNASTWRAVSTSHHIGLTLTNLRSGGEP